MAETTSKPANLSDQYDRYVEAYAAATTEADRARILDEAVRVLPQDYAFNFKNAAKRIDRESPVVVPEEPEARAQPDAGGRGGSGTLDLGDVGAVKDFGGRLWSAVTGALTSESNAKGLLSYLGVDDSVEAVRAAVEFAKGLESAGGFDPATGRTYTPSPGGDPEVLAAERAAREAEQAAAAAPAEAAARSQAVVDAVRATQPIGPFDLTRTAVHAYNRRWLNEIGLTDPELQRQVSDYFIRSASTAEDASFGNLKTYIEGFRETMSDDDIAVNLVLLAQGVDVAEMGRTVKPRQVLIGDQMLMSQTGGLVNQYGELALDSNGKPYQYDAGNPVVFLYELSDVEYADWVGQLFDWGLLESGDTQEVQYQTGQLLNEANQYGLTLEAMSKKYWEPRFGTTDGRPRLGAPIQLSAADTILASAQEEAIAALGRGLTDAEKKAIVRQVHAMETNDAYARQSVQRAAVMGEEVSYEGLGSLESITNRWMQNNLSFESQRAREMSAALYLSNLGQ